jgi:hypothetical protein
MMDAEGSNLPLLAVAPRYPHARFIANRIRLYAENLGEQALRCRLKMIRIRRHPILGIQRRVHIDNRPENDLAGSVVSRQTATVCLFGLWG